MGAGTGPGVTSEVSEYCRRIETYLCQKNEGHLIRIVGPAFEQVCGWAAQGVPLNVAFRGIDQYCERYYAKGPRRRPVRIEFCEADILGLFDDWRRAVGIGASGGAAAETAETSRKPGLVSHLERVMARLTSLRTGNRCSPVFDEQVDSAVRELDGFKGDAPHARGERRASLISRLEELDRRLTDAAIAEIPRDVAQRLRREADEELAPFAARMTAEAHTAAAAAAFARLVREALGLPTIRFE